MRDAPYDLRPIRLMWLMWPKGSAGDTPVSRQRFVQDLAYLGVPEIRDADGTCFLVRK